jgi:subfamily B ATP-binding cassette protein MsbA
MPVFRRLLTYVRPYSSYLFISLGSLVVYALLSSAMLYLVKPLFAHLFESGTPPVTPDAATGFDALRAYLDFWVEKWIESSTTVGTLERIGVLIVLVTVVKTVFYYFNGWAITHMEQGVVKGLRDELYVKLHNLSLAYFDRHRTGHLVSRVTNDVSVIQETLATTLTQMIREPLMSLFYLYLLLSISWPLTLLAALVVPVAAFLVARLGFVLRRYSTHTQERMADVNDILEETHDQGSPAGHPRRRSDGCDHGGAGVVGGSQAGICGGKHHASRVHHFSCVDVRSGTTHQEPLGCAH